MHDGNILIISHIFVDLFISILSICVQRLRALTRPTKYWGPALVQHRKLVDYVEDFVVDPWTDDNISSLSDDQTLAQAIDHNVSLFTCTLSCRINVARLFYRSSSRLQISAFVMAVIALPKEYHG